MLFRSEGISRVCLAQLTRSKHLDYLVRSSRYCDESEALFKVPPSLQDVSSQLKTEVTEFMWESHYLYRKLLAEGVKKEDARYFLLQAQETELYIAGNYQAWKDFINLRTKKAAQKEVRDVAVEIENQLKELAPIIFGENHD